MIATTPTIDNLLSNHAPVAIGVSGGKDSTAAAFAACEHLDQHRHAGPRVLIHLHEEYEFPLHEAYRTNTRVSCVFCVLASRGDLVASTTWPEHAELYREMVDLEIASTFAFQDSGWLGDLAPHLLTAAQRSGLAEAKRKARERVRIEAEIPPHLLYTKGWPTCMPTGDEARVIARVRRGIGELFDLDVLYTDASTVEARYAELMARRPQGNAVLVQEAMFALESDL